MPFTTRAKQILELSLREAIDCGHDYIGTEHLLLGLLREGEGVAVQILINLGVDLDRTRQAVLDNIPNDEDLRASGEHLTDDRARLRREITRLRRLLTQHGIDPDSAE